MCSHVAIARCTRWCSNPSRIREVKEQTGFSEVDASGRAGVSLAGFVLELEQPAYVKMFFVSERLAAAVGAGDITDDESRNFLATLEERHRAGTFYGNAVGYSVAGTKV